MVDRQRRWRRRHQRGGRRGLRRLLSVGGGGSAGGRAVEKCPDQSAVDVQVVGQEKRIVSRGRLHLAGTDGLVPVDRRIDDLLALMRPKEPVAGEQRAFARIFGPADIEELLGPDRSQGGVTVAQGEGLLCEVLGCGVGQIERPEVGNPVGQPGEVLKDLKVGPDDLGQLVPGVSDMHARNERVGNRQAVSANPAEKFGVDLADVSAKAGTSGQRGSRRRRKELQSGGQNGIGYAETMSAKEILLEVAEKLPPDATLDDAIYELEFRQAVQQGLDELDRGEGFPIEEVKAKIAEWAGK